MNYGVYNLRTGVAGQSTVTIFPLSYTTTHYAPIISTMGALGPGSYGASIQTTTQFRSAFVRTDSVVNNITAQFICIGY